MFKTRLPPDAEALVTEARALGRFVRFGPAGDPALEVDCLNCNDHKLVCVQVEDSKSKSIVYDEGKAVHVRTEMHSCPACTSNDATINFLLDNSGLEDHERLWRLDYYDGMEGKGEPLDAARLLLSGTPRPAGWLTLYGVYGRGKSGILKSLTAAFCRALVPARYTRAEDILASIRASFGDRHAPSQPQIEAKLGHLRFLAIDEVDRVADSDWAQATLFRLFDVRYNRRRITATGLAMNVTPDALPERMKYLSSRMTDGVMHIVGGRNLRGQDDLEETPAA